LIFISLVVPYRIAFSEKDGKSWEALYIFIDSCFGLDILLTFNTSYTEEVTTNEIWDRKRIILNYLEGWFWLDIIAIIPFDKFFSNSQGNLNAVAKFARIGRLYKLIRMTRLAKLFKLLKSKNTILTQFSTRLKIDHGQERLIFLGFFMIFFFHMATCFFVIIAQLIEAGDHGSTLEVPKTWLAKQGLWNKDDATYVFHAGNTYIYALYFTVTTVATVGYGDIAATNSYERVFCIMLMLIGVMLFTFVSGALSSILSNYDNQ